MTAEQTTLLINLAISVVLPLLVGLVTTKTTTPGTRAILLLVLATLQTLLGQILVAFTSTGNFDWFAWIVTAAGSFLVGVGTHFGLWKPTGASTAAIDAGRTATS